MVDDTIAAIATPLGEAGLAVIRLSGPQALSVADACFLPAGKSALKPSAAPSHTIHYGRGVRAAIIGRPNAGKSSLLNQLLGRDRAIVSPIPGTTRDTIEETANIRGLPVVFIDTAGLRTARDEIEQEGIRRSRQSLQQAELILHVVDTSQPFVEEDRNYLADLDGKKRIVVLNKVDLSA